MTQFKISRASTGQPKPTRSPTSTRTARFSAIRRFAHSGEGLAEIANWILGHSPDGTEAQKKNWPQCIGKSRSGWNTKTDIVSASDRLAMVFRLSDGQAHDAPEGRALLERWDKPVANAPLAMDRAPTKATRPAASLRPWG